MNNEELVQEVLAEVKQKIIAVMHEFTEKYAAPDSKLYPHCGRILVNALADCLTHAQYQIADHLQFNPRQIDHICYQIGEWYLNWKDVLIDWNDKTHRLGVAKEQLKTMICGENKKELTQPMALVLRYSAVQLGF